MENRAFLAADKQRADELNKKKIMRHHLAGKKQKLQRMWTSHIQNRNRKCFQVPGPGSYEVKDYMIDDPTFAV
jgi:hypothetical protein